MKYFWMWKMEWNMSCFGRFWQFRQFWQFWHCLWCLLWTGSILSGTGNLHGPFGAPLVGRGRVAVSGNVALVVVDFIFGKMKGKRAGNFFNHKNRRQKRFQLYSDGKIHWECSYRHWCRPCRWLALAWQFSSHPCRRHHGWWSCRFPPRWECCYRQRWSRSWSTARSLKIFCPNKTWNFSVLVY